MKNINPIQSILEEDSKNESFVAAILKHLEDQIQKMGSLKGIVVRKTYASVQSIRPGYVEHILKVLTKDYIHEFSGMHADYLKSQTLPSESPASFDTYIKAHFKEAEEHFWKVADDYAEKRHHTVIGKAYMAGRSTIASHLPQMLEIICNEIDRHTFYEV